MNSTVNNVLEGFAASITSSENDVEQQQQLSDDLSHRGEVMRDKTEDISSTADEDFSEGNVTAEEKPPWKQQREGCTFGFLFRLGLVSKKELTPTNDGDGVTKDDSKANRRDNC